MRQQPLDPEAIILLRTVIATLVAYGVPEKIASALLVQVYVAGTKQGHDRALRDAEDAVNRMALYMRSAA